VKGMVDGGYVVETFTVEVKSCADSIITPASITD
jgi:hypothetical protein